MNELLECVVHHRAQEKRNYCVPACACIGLSRLGRQMSQDEVCADWQGSPHGFPLESAAQILGGTHHTLDPDAPGNYGWIQWKLQSSHWIVAAMFAEKIAKVVQAMTPGPISRLGPIWGGELGAHHAVVLTGAIDRRFYYLDPFYPALGQPWSMSRRDFAQAFTGYLIEVPVG